MKNKGKEKWDVFWKILGIGLIAIAAIITISIMAYDASYIGLNEGESPTILTGIMCVLFGEGIFFLWKKDKKRADNFSFIAKKGISLMVGVVVFLIAVLIGILIKLIISLFTSGPTYGIYVLIAIAAVIIYFLLNWVIDELRG